MRIHLTRKKTALILSVIALVIFSDLIICRRTYYLPQADVYVQQRHRPSKRGGYTFYNYFGRHPFVLFFKKYKAMDIVAMENLTEIGCILFLDPDNQILYLTGSSGGYNEYVSHTEYNYKTVMVKFNGHIVEGSELAETYLEIRNSHWLISSSFDVPEGRKAHLYHIFRIPWRKHDSYQRIRKNY